MSQAVLPTLHVLILHESSDIAEQMINSLRNAGHATRAHHISATDDFTELLKSKVWDMLIARPNTDFLNAEKAIQSIQTLEKDIPSIILLDENEFDQVNDFLQHGAEDAIPQNDSLRIQLVVGRELKNLSNRRKMRHAERANKETEKRSNQLLDQSKDAIAYVIDGMHVYGNQAYLEKFGFEDEEDIAITPIMDLIAKSHKSTFKNFLKAGSDSSTEELNEIEIKACQLDGTQFDATLFIAQAEYDGEACTQIKIPANAENPELQKQLDAYKNQDMVTGLPNQNVFENVLDQSVEKAAKENGTYALLNIRLDDFGKIKSQIGVAESDILLGYIAEKLQSYFPNPQFIARFSTDTFVAIDYEKDLESAKALAEKIRNELAEAMFEIEQRTIQVTLSVGIAFINDVTTDGDVVLNKAYEACNLAYANDGNGNAVHAYEPLAAKKTLQTLNVSETLQDAMDNGRLKVLYQPIISLEDDSEQSYEVFMRLHDEEGKEISLADYLEGIATDEIGEKVDRWVILQAIKALSEKYNKGSKIKLFINITERSMLDKSLIPWLGVALKAARLPGEALVFQVAETEAIAYLTQAASFSKELNKINCQVALKHFGSALNPLNIVQHMSIDYFKIDKSFVDNLSSPENKETLLTLINGVHMREKKIIIPFIETASMLSNVWQLGVDYIQGYYFQEPHEIMDYDFDNEDDA